MELKEWTSDTVHEIKECLVLLSEYGQAPSLFRNACKNRNLYKSRLYFDSCVGWLQIR